MALPVIVGAVAKVGGAILAEKAIDKAIDVGSNSLKNSFSAMKERCGVNQENHQKRYDIPQPWESGPSGGQSLLPEASHSGSVRTPGGSVRTKRTMSFR